MTTKLFDTKIFSDITIKCSDEKEIKAHRTVLACGSPVFEKILTTEMTEKKTNHIIVDDIDSITINILLIYTYTHYEN
jgi:hypothetical protein